MSAGTATKRSRIGHRLLLKMGLRKVGFCPMFDEAHEKYTWLTHYVEEMQESLSAYALQLARMTEAARGVGEDASHIYLVRERGFKPAVAFKEAQDMGHSGYAGQLQQALVKGVVEPIGEWLRDLESIEGLVTDFNEIRVQHDHYRLKVEDLSQKARALEARATTRGDSRDAKQAAEKLKRNTKKLNEVTVEFDKKLSSCCNRMTRAWEDREKMMNGIVARIVHFQESFFAEQLMNSLGVARILSAAEGGGPRWGGTMGIEPFVPKGHVRHYEGELLRKHMVMKERMWYRLVGSSLEVYDMKPKEGRDNTPMYVVTELPVTVHEVKGVTKVSGVNFRVTVLGGGETGGGGLNLYAADEVDGKGWMDALTRASEWDQLASSSKAAGIAPGGEAGVAMAGAAAAAAAVMAAKAKGKGGKKGDGGGEKNPELANNKKGGGGRGGGGLLPPGLAGPGGPVGGMGGGVGIGGSFNSRTGRAGLGPSGVGMPFGNMGSHMNPPSFSGSSFSGSSHSHSSMGGLGGGGGGGGSQMGDPRLHMAAQQMGMSSNGRSGGGPGGPPMGPMPPHFDPPQMSGPPVNPSTGLPVGMRQNGPPIVLPAGMVPRGGGPVVNPPIPPPSMPVPSMPGPWGSTPQQQQQQQQPGWGGGGGGGLGTSRSFTSRFGMKQGAAGRQQGFRRSSSFGDWLGPSGVGQPLSPTMEVDSFETQSTRSAPPFGATATVGDATAAAEAATAAAAKVAAGGHVTGTEETKSSTKDKKGDEGADKATGAKAAAAAAVAAAAAATAAAGAAAAGSKFAEPPAAVPPAPAPGVVTIQTIHTKKDAPRPPAPAPAPAAESKKSAPAASASAAAAAAAIPLSDLFKRGDDGGLSRYDTSGETPARARSKPASTWKRMMSFGGAGSSYRYDAGDAGVSGEGKSSAEEVSESDSALAAKAKNDGTQDSAALTTAEVSRRTDSGATAGSSGGSVVADTPSSAASTRATVGDPTPVIPAVEPPSESPAGGCEYITPAYFAAFSAATTPAPAGGPGSGANPATTSSAAASSAGAAAALTPRTAAASAATAAAEASNDAVAAQAKVFQRLCDSSGSETETGDAGGGAAAGAFGEESTLSFRQLMGWDEVQELLEFGALKEGELTTLWQEAARAQDAELGTGGDPRAQTTDIWGSGSPGAANAAAAAPGSQEGGSGGSTRDVLTVKGFMILVKLIEELQFEKELEQDKGVGLVPGPVCVV
ncbi:conserved unknown protein [Ectocarpus siliculosus]|uniref:PH domain-containing protein n=1 Tax=Ectocarpus siliculosus TaxID=2880 RepID=D7FWV3_ECTSI|nr:conserved unknown protein [Ectocarpus siliculosus]|eukprot:CBJ32191.1 conserved unknown protein [Ectocarpus siliculosus]